ncbi:N-acetyltransferase [Antribacter sp. KLBMP9083]|uniref:N-acetyltransferase n=1 Tax=Antribacter soli TaxID=2910976 RepID=A0AA41QDS9_9MICO|nr:N-acetyltransferase [Antribacter soli]MCF4121593.1 N-acetyltransferase [Antribacter soli]
MTVQIRAEQPADFPAIRDVLVAAFGEDRVADGVERIRESWIYRPATSLVAVSDDVVVGCVMITGCTVSGDAGDRVVAMLTPLAVAPDRQRQGIGAALVRAVLAGAEAAGEPLVVLEGSPTYYGALGFEPARLYGLIFTLPDWAPPDAGQVYLLPSYDRADPTLRGKIGYPPVYE